LKSILNFIEFISDCKIKNLFETLQNKKYLFLKKEIMKLRFFSSEGGMVLEK